MCLCGVEGVHIDPRGQPASAPAEPDVVLLFVKATQTLIVSEASWQV